MIDLHTHLAPGVDDGARSAGQAAQVLARLVADGVRTLVCTPHLRASLVARGGAAWADDAARVCSAFDALAAVAPGGVALRLGREVMLDEPGVALHVAPEALLDGGPAVLVEFPYGPAPVAADRELARLRADGLRPLLAHPERYDGVDVARVAGWRRAGAAVQVDATTLCAPNARGRLARAIVAAGEADVLASDNHGDARTLAAARAWLGERGLDALADLLTRENPARLLRGDDPVPPPPAPVVARAAGGLAAWLRARLFPPTPAAHPSRRAPRVLRVPRLLRVPHLLAPTPSFACLP